MRLELGIGLAATEGEGVRLSRFGGERQERGAVIHQRLVRLFGPVPLQHRELRMVQRPALAVPEHAGDIEDPALSRRQQLLAGELR